MPRPGQLGGPGLPGHTRITEATVRSKSVMEQDAWGRFISEAQRSGDQLMQKLGEKMAARARARAPHRTGRLKRSIKFEVFNHGRAVRVYSEVPYAGVMEDGSKPHLIHGVKANFDWKKGRFNWNDPRFGPVGTGRPGTYKNWTKTHGATVNHPGTRPHLFFARAFTETWAEARLVMREVYPK